MAFVNNLRIKNCWKECFCIALVLILISCAELGKKSEKPPVRPAADSISFEPRENLLHWHDETFKTYYGLKGPVEHVVINPALDSNGEMTTDGWQLWFSEQGRLTRKQRLAVETEPAFETVYEYNRRGQSLKSIKSYLGKKIWRTSKFHYREGQLARVDYIDHQNNERFRVKRGKQNTVNGWVDVQLPVEKIELPRYNEFSQDGRLVWSNKGDINNGLGEMFFIRTVDAVTSSSVVNQNTDKMTGRGGYRYGYYENGLLKKVESYNAHDNRLFHVTNYKYDDLRLLVEENRTVKDSSVFNQVVPEQVSYDYHSIDSHGNWLDRTLRYNSTHQKQSYREKRNIIYYK